MDSILCVSLSVLLFICFALGYREGLRLGMRSAKGIEPKPIKTPVAAIKDTVDDRKERKEADEQARIYEAFEQYDGYTEKEREWMRGRR